MGCVLDLEDAWLWGVELVGCDGVGRALKALLTDIKTCPGVEKRGEVSMMKSVVPLGFL